MRKTQKTESNTYQREAINLLQNFLTDKEVEEIHIHKENENGKIYTYLTLTLVHRGTKYVKP